MGCCWRFVQIRDSWRDASVAASPIIESARSPPEFSVDATVGPRCGAPLNGLAKRFRLAAGCVACGLALVACGKKPPPPMPPPTVGYVVLRAQPVPLIADLPGRVAAFESSDVRPQVNGIVRQRTFVEGSTVRAGQILYVIEDAPFRAAVLNAEGLLAQAEANIRSTQLQAERFRRLVVVNGVSKQEADNADAAAAQAKALALAQRGVLNSAQVNL